MSSSQNASLAIKMYSDYPGVVPCNQCKLVSPPPIKISSACKGVSFIMMKDESKDRPFLYPQHSVIPNMRLIAWKDFTWTGFLYAKKNYCKEGLVKLRVQTFVSNKEKSTDKIRIRCELVTFSYFQCGYCRILSMDTKLEYHRLPLPHSWDFLTNAFSISVIVLSSPITIESNMMIVLRAELSSRVLKDFHLDRCNALFLFFCSLQVWSTAYTDRNKVNFHYVTSVARNRFAKNRPLQMGVGLQRDFESDCMRTWH